MAKRFELGGGEANKAADAATVSDAATAYATAAIDTATASAAAIIWMTL